MTKHSRKRSAKSGLPPGTPVHVGRQRTEMVRITLMAYDGSRFAEKQAVGVEECLAAKADGGVTWINVDGIHDVELIERIGKAFDLHPLVQEDIVNTTQRPKAEDYDQSIFVVAKMLMWGAEQAAIRSEQVSFVLSRGVLLSFQEVEGDVFDTIRDRIRNDKGRIRRMGADYLLYSLLDAIQDHYFVVLENFGELIEDLEDRGITDPSPPTLQSIHHLKGEMVALRRAAWPMRDVMSSLQRGQSALIGKETQLYLRDAYDHSVQVIETAETYRDMLSGLLDIYLSSVSNKMNEVMKVLTIIATIFIPLTFIAGVYGMNFNPDSSPLSMPELKWYWGYPVALGLMVLVAALMVLFFRRKRWL